MILLFEGDAYTPTLPLFRNPAMQHTLSTSVAADSTLCFGRP